jgi:hypothetical protein
VLARAVAAAVIDPDERLIISTRRLAPRCCAAREPSWGVDTVAVMIDNRHAQVTLVGVTDTD